LDIEEDDGFMASTFSPNPSTSVYVSKDGACSVPVPAGLLVCSSSNAAKKS
jgi:hypothetical protein